MTDAGLRRLTAAGAQQLKRKMIVHQEEKQAREYIMQLEKKRDYIHAWVNEATEDQLTGVIREIARQILAGPTAATGKMDKKKKIPTDRKKAQLCCRLDRRDGDRGGALPQFLNTDWAMSMVTGRIPAAVP